MSKWVCLHGEAVSSLKDLMTVAADSLMERIERDDLTSFTESSVKKMLRRHWRLILLSR